jgi:hypothetical protein
MPVPTCSNCLAVLPDAHLLASCPYCGASTGTLHVAPADIAERRTNLIRAGLMIFAVLFVAVPIYELIGPYVAKKLPDSVPVVQKADELHSLGEAATEISPIGTTGLGPLDKLDPLAQIPWFSQLASTWTADARLARLDLHGVRRDGTMDLTTSSAGSYVRYEFASATRNTAAVQQRKVVDTLLWSAIDIELKGGVLRASVVSNSNEDRAPSPLSFACTVPKLIDLWRTKGLPAKETYNIELSDQRGPKPDYAWQSHDWGVPKVGLDCHLRWNFARPQ